MMQKQTEKIKQKPDLKGNIETKGTKEQRQKIGEIALWNYESATPNDKSPAMTGTIQINGEKHRAVVWNKN